MKIDISSPWFRNIDLGGSRLLLMELVGIEGPIGYLTYTATLVGQKGKSALVNIIDCYVPARYQKEGVMSAMINYLTQTFDTIRTDIGSSTGGVALLKSCGFKETKQFGWVLCVKKPHVNKSKKR